MPSIAPQLQRCHTQLQYCYSKFKLKNENNGEGFEKEKNSFLGGFQSYFPLDYNAAGPKKKQASVIWVNNLTLDKNA